MIRRLALTVLLALAICASAQAKNLPPHQGHPILPVSAAEAARERAMLKSFPLRTARPALPRR